MVINLVNLGTCDILKRAADTYKIEINPRYCYDKCVQLIRKYCEIQFIEKFDIDVRRATQSPVPNRQLDFDCLVYFNRTASWLLDNLRLKFERILIERYCGLKCLVSDF